MFETRVLSDLKEKEMKKLLEDLGCEKEGVNIMTPKSQHFLVYSQNLDPRAANIVKQEFLAAGGEAAVSWKALNLSEDRSKLIMMGTMTQFKRVLKKLKAQPFDLETLAEEVRRSLKNYRYPASLPWGGKECQIMGILNVTPDSFYDGGKFDVKEKAVGRAIEMVENGADIIDVGGESTRPGSERISLEKEKERVIPVIKELKNKIDVKISIDTYKPEIAEAAVEAGADIVNDVFGLRKEGMIQKIAELDVPIIIMHMQGEPKNMQDNPVYEDVITDISSFFIQQTEKAIEVGVKEENIIIDPGIGFGKKLEHNLEILKRLDEFKSLGYPILLGASRKSFLGQILNKKAENRLSGSLAVAADAVTKGAGILRVHDVRETVDVIDTIQAIKN